jgi:hypothetical protein
MGSEFDDWVYLNFFTITTNHNSSHIELLLNEIWLLSDECRMKNLSEEFLSLSESEFYITTDGYSASLS